MKPTFLVLGAAKCGTTSLCALLGSHPDVFMAEPKELNFFAYDDLYARGPAWYEQHFAYAGSRRARGEGSPLYSLSGIYPAAPRRIAEYDGRLKLIYIARNPIERIEAGWLEMRSWGDETAHPDFAQALKTNREWLIDSSNYWNEIQHYRKHFADEQILVLFFDDFVADWRSVLRECFAFLEVDPYANVDEALRFLNRTEDKRVRRPGVSRLRSLPGVAAAFAVARRCLPEGIRKPIRNHVLNASVRARPEWSASSRAWVVEQLADDTERFLRFYGKPADFWRLR